MLSCGGRGALHDALFFRLRGQGEPRQTVGHQINPQDVDRQKRNRQEQEWS